MAYFDTPELPDPKGLPQVMVGAASPLWAYFGAAAAGGVAFWWMTQWARPANLEVLFAKGDAVAVPALEPVLQAVEAVAETPVVAANLAAAPEPAVQPESAAEPVLEIAPGPQPAAQVAPEPYTWEDPAPPLGFESEPAAEPAKPRVRKAAAPPMPE